jgi:hypothetical protein
MSVDSADRIQKLHDACERALLRLSEAPAGDPHLVLAIQSLRDDTASLLEAAARIRARS